jgi:hypothetical protein
MIKMIGHFQETISNFLKSYSTLHLIEGRTGKLKINKTQNNSKIKLIKIIKNLTKKGGVERTNTIYEVDIEDDKSLKEMLKKRREYQSNLQE